MPATHSFSLTPKASKLLRAYKYPRKLGGASKSVSDAIEFFWTENVVTMGQELHDGVERDPVTLACVNCGSKYYKREIRVVGNLHSMINKLTEELQKSNEELDELKNRRKWWRLWQKRSGSE